MHKLHLRDKTLLDLTVKDAVKLYLLYVVVVAALDVADAKVK